MRRTGFGTTISVIPRDPKTGNCPSGFKAINETSCSEDFSGGGYKLPVQAEVIKMDEMDIIGTPPKEPLIRVPNIVSAAVAGGMFLIKWRKMAAVLSIINALDIVGRQVSPQYRGLVNPGKLPVAGLGFIPGINNVRWR